MMRDCHAWYVVACDVSSVWYSRRPGHAGSAAEAAEVERSVEVAVEAEAEAEAEVEAAEASKRAGTLSARRAAAAGRTAREAIMLSFETSE